MRPVGGMPSQGASKSPVRWPIETTQREWKPSIWLRPAKKMSSRRFRPVRLAWSGVQKCSATGSAPVISLNGW